jgi:hypothetical protein
MYFSELLELLSLYDMKLVFGDIRKGMRILPNTRSKS